MSASLVEQASDDANREPLLCVEQLKVHLPVGRALWGRVPTIKAVDGVSFEIPRGKTLGLVGESGCGKSTLARAILRLIPATQGAVHFDGIDVLALPPRQLRPLRRRMQIVFQDALGSLNPRLRIETIVGEALTVHGLVHTRRERQQRVDELLARVGLPPDALGRFPHEFSGGQRQRIGIARALALRPELVICDEPVSALDVSIQSQILNLLGELQQELGLSYLMIAHNLAVIRHCSDDVAVMYLGRIVEHGPPDEVFVRPAHPYTRALLASAPEPDPRVARARAADGHALPLLTGEPPSPVHPPPGCPFHPRCPIAQERCWQEAPMLESHAGLAPTHRAACHFTGAA